jgi:hypothetical protein
MGFLLESPGQLADSQVPPGQTAARQDRIETVKGLGPALQRKIVQGLEIRKTALGARHLHRAAELIALAEKFAARPARH